VVRLSIFEHAYDTVLFSEEVFRKLFHGKLTICVSCEEKDKICVSGWCPQHGITSWPSIQRRARVNRSMDPWAWRGVVVKDVSIERATTTPSSLSFFSSIVCARNQQRLHRPPIIYLRALAYVRNPWDEQAPERTYCSCFSIAHASQSHREWSSAQPEQVERESRVDDFIFYIDRGEWYGDLVCACVRPARRQSLHSPAPAQNAVTYSVCL
jgi:hypothetical protein